MEKLTELTLKIYCKRQAEGLENTVQIHTQQREKRNEIIKEKKCSYERT